MNKQRRISFLVKLKGLAQGLAPQETHAVGYKQTEWEKNQIEQTLASWNLWLQSGRLVDYHEDDFPDVSHTEKERVTDLICKFEGYAGRHSELTENEKNQALDLLVLLIRVFTAQLSNTHGEPGERDNSE